MANRPTPAKTFQRQGASLQRCIIVPLPERPASLLLQQWFEALVLEVAQQSNRHTARDTWKPAVGL